MSSQTNVVSFVLRFVQETTDTPAAAAKQDWHGLIRHVQTDREERFTRLIDAITFMSRYLDLAEIRMILRAVGSDAGNMAETPRSE